MQACNPNAWAVQAGKSEVQGHPQLHSKFEASLSIPPLRVLGTGGFFGGGESLSWTTQVKSSSYLTHPHK